MRWFFRLDVAYLTLCRRLFGGKNIISQTIYVIPWMLTALAGMYVVFNVFPWWIQIIVMTTVITVVFATWMLNSDFTRSSQMTDEELGLDDDDE